MKNDLTEKQKAFCRYKLDGMTNVQAYQKAYNSTSYNSAATESTKLLKDEAIQKYIENLKKPILEEIQLNQLNDRQKQINFISDRIAICKKNRDEGSIVRYTDMLNKIYGIYQNVIAETDEKEKSVEKLDMDTLKALASGL